MTWWLIVKTPAGVSGWDVGDPDGDRKTDLVERAKTLTDFPAGDAWVHERDHDIQLTPGEPHPTLLGDMAVRLISELDAVTAEALAGWRSDDTRLRLEAQVTAAESVLAELPDEVVDALLARLRPPTPEMTTEVRNGR